MAFAPSTPWKLPCIITWDGSRNQNLPTDSAEEAKIEHWRSQAGSEAGQLDYSNLLGACMGNEGKPIRDQHCDTRKGNRVISRNPANPAHRVDEVLRFLDDGRIISNDEVFDDEINNVLAGRLDPLVIPMVPQASYVLELPITAWRTGRVDVEHLGALIKRQGQLWAELDCGHVGTTAAYSGDADHDSETMAIAIPN